MRQGTKKFMATALGVGAVGFALPIIAGTPAYATGSCPAATIEYSLDNGKTWTKEGRMDGTLVTKIKVRLTGDIKKDCEYDVSLASYSAEGPTWPTSGTQKFLGWDTTKLDKDKKKDTLDVTEWAPKCFGQVDLYGNGKKYDGVENPLPKYPHGVFPKSLITAWNGGKKCDEPTPPTSQPPTSKPPTSQPPSSQPPTSQAPSSQPPTSKPPTSQAPSSQPPTSVKPTSSPSTTPPPPGDVKPPEGKPEVPPVNENPPPSLAETGGDSNTVAIVGASAGALLIGGAGVLVWSRRRNNGATPA